MTRLRLNTFLAAAAIGMALVATSSDRASAACNGTAIEHDQAECLTMTKEISTGVPVITSVTLVNDCSALGSLVVNVEPDRGLSSKLTVATRGFTSMSGGVSSVECCRDEGDLCDKADIVNAANCNAQFEGSKAAESCDVDTSQTETVDDEQCKLTLVCKLEDGSHRSRLAQVDYPDVDDLQFCDDEVSVGTSCE